MLSGAVSATAIAALSWRARALTASGAAAAAVLGTFCVAAGWDWGILLIAYFVASTALTRWGRARKGLLTGGIIAKGGPRDARQVLANGALFGAAALAWTVDPRATWMAAGAGSLAASAADTWGTELGTLMRGPTRLITSLRPVAPGTSGGVSAGGLVATVAGAAFVAAVVWTLQWPMPVVTAAAIGGVIGAILDSVLGATVQARHRCPRCGADTEQAVHDCGAPTERAGGWSWLDNDAVNLACNLTGALIAAWIAG